MVRFIWKHATNFFIGIVDENNQQDTEVHVNFLKKKSDCFKFVYPNKVDGSWIDFNDIETILTPLDNEGVYYGGYLVLHLCCISDNGINKCAINLLKICLISMSQ